MKTRLLAVLLFLSIIHARAQVIKKYSVGETGCNVYGYCSMKFETALSDDSSTVYTGQCANENVDYGVICVKLLRPIGDLDDAESVMESYLEYLKGNFNITSAAGYGRGHVLNNNEQTRGILDYWKDKEKLNWKVKAWTDGTFIAVLYARSKKELPENKVNIYLDGFRFPGM